MNRSHTIEIFAELGNRLVGFGNDSTTKALLDSAITSNPWFMAGDIIRSVDAIRANMLEPQLLGKWLDGYDINYDKQHEVGVIMAGNVPLVGFFDLLCVLASGNRCLVKTSSKDHTLMSYVCDLLKNICADIPITAYNPQTDKTPDAIIATGSGNTNRYFRALFRDIPSLLRSGRGSIAVLQGDETDDKLLALADDIFSYSSLGCRNVSLVMVPDKYNIRNLNEILRRFRPVNDHYRNNYLQRRAVLSIENKEFADGKFYVISEGDTLPSAISEIVIYRYRSIKDVDRWLKYNDSVIQCVVSDFYNHPRTAAIGKAQSPTLWDYADGLDTMRFLTDMDKQVENIYG